MFVKTYLCVKRDGGDVELTKNMYYPLSNARCFQCISREQHTETLCLFGGYSSFEVDNPVHFCLNVLVEKEEMKCKAKDDGCIDSNCPLLDLFYPIYAMLTTDPMDPKTIQWVLIHPDERDRMERFLAGTLDPMHDLVHELRIQIGKDVQDAKNDFNKRMRGE